MKHFTLEDLQKDNCEYYYLYFGHLQSYKIISNNTERITIELIYENDTSVSLGSISI